MPREWDLLEAIAVPIPPKEKNVQILKICRGIVYINKDVSRIITTRRRQQKNVIIMQL